MISRALLIVPGGLALLAASLVYWRPPTLREGQTVFVQVGDAVYAVPAAHRPGAVGERRKINIASEVESGRGTRTNPILARELYVVLNEERSRAGEGAHITISDMVPAGAEEARELGPATRLRIASINLQLDEPSSDKISGHLVFALSGGERRAVPVSCAHVPAGVVDEEGHTWACRLSLQVLGGNWLGLQVNEELRLEEDVLASLSLVDRMAVR